MNKNKIQKIQNLGTIAGLKELVSLLGVDYIYPKVSFFALEYGIFREEDSHFVLYNSTIKIKEEEIIFISENREVEIIYSDSSKSFYFNGNKSGSMLYNSKHLTFIEFTTDEYFINVFFDDLLSFQD